MAVFHHPLMQLTNTLQVPYLPMGRVHTIQYRPTHPCKALPKVVCGL